MEAIQILANIATFIAMIVMINQLIIERKIFNENRITDHFYKLLEQYNKIYEKRKDIFLKIKEVVINDPKTKHEIDDKSSSISYLLIRLSQNEPFFSIEHSLLQHEILSMILLNQLCKICIETKNEILFFSLVLKESSEISFYKSNIKNIVNLYNSQNKILRLYKPRIKYLIEIDVEKYFDQTDIT